jgi:hypothetical protein
MTTPSRFPSNWPPDAPVGQTNSRPRRFEILRDVEEDRARTRLDKAKSKASLRQRTPPTPGEDFLIHKQRRSLRRRSERRRAVRGVGLGFLVWLANRENHSNSGRWFRDSQGVPGASQTKSPRTSLEEPTLQCLRKGRRPQFFQLLSSCFPPSLCIERDRRACQRPEFEFVQYFCFSLQPILQSQPISKTSVAKKLVSAISDASADRRV